MRLHDVLHQVVDLLRDGERGRAVGAVTIARDAPRSYQARFIRDASIERGYRVSGRRWIVETRPGTEFEGWSPWSNFLGFSVEAAMSGDWKIYIVEAHS